jgi:predicted PurR-regulated permease PerM
MTTPPAAVPEFKPAQVDVLRVEVSLSTMMYVVLVVATLWLVTKLVPVVLVLIAALFIVGTLSPIIEWLVIKRWHRNAAIGVVFAALTVLSLALIALTLPEIADQARSLVSHEPALRARVVAWLRESPLTAPLADSLRNMKYGAMLGAPADAFVLSGRILEFAAYSMGAIFLALYILIDRDRLRGALFAVVPRNRHMRLSRIMMNLETIVGGYIRGQLLTCVMIGVFMFVLLTACGVPNALALATFGAVADVLPYVGALLTIIPAVAAALTRGPFIVGVILVALLAYEELESRVIVPIVYGRALRLPSSVVMFSLLVGATLYGVIGALLALPLAAAILMLIDEMRVALPGEPDAANGDALQRRDDRGNRLYERLTEGMPAEQAAAIAVELSDERKRNETESASASASASASESASSALAAAAAVIAAAAPVNADDPVPPPPLNQ